MHGGDGSLELRAFRARLTVAGIGGPVRELALPTNIRPGSLKTDLDTAGRQAEGNPNGGRLPALTQHVVRLSIPGEI